MGAWGDGPFDNDDAGDWSYEFEGADEAAGLEILSTALDVGASQEYLEVQEGSIAVAAAAVVSWLRDPNAIPDSPYGEDAAAWVRSVESIPPPSLITAALRALDRARSDQSELAELWAEADDAGWRQSIADIERRLRLSR